MKLERRNESLSTLTLGHKYYIGHKQNYQEANVIVTVYKRFYLALWFRGVIFFRLLSQGGHWKGAEYNNAFSPPTLSTFKL